ncbi:MAG: N-acetylmuramoyl-L-alanine amidase [Clostridia bacterium]|nr:N-acetylmuramoyl-L-alanine amidase [Clostridia bacterium]
MKQFRFIALVIFLLLVIAVLMLCGLYFLFSKPQHIKAQTTAKKTQTIVLDCGHGGPDGGAVGADGTLEKDINLSLGFALREILLQNGYTVVMTRETDDFICDDHSASLREQNVSDLHNRLKIAESYPDSVFISLHMNNFSQKQYWGSQLFYSPNHPNSRVLAEAIRSRLVQSVQKGNERALKQMDSSVYIIYRATHPALLLECGFMSNQKELNRFKDKKYRSNFAFAVFLGINDYLTGENDGEKQH